MAGPIYKAFRLSFSEAWYRLLKEERDNLIGKVGEALRTVGGQAITPLCDAAWSNERWEIFGVEMYPSVEAVQQHAEILRELDWPRYHTHSTLLGTAIPT